MAIDEQELVQDYEINPFTMMILPYEMGNKTYSQIIEFEKIYISPIKPTELVKRGCEYNLSDYNACKKVTRRLTRVTHKAPIAIDPSNSVYLLPTKSPNKSECIWVSHEHVLDHRRQDAHNSKITLSNKETYVLPISFASFEKQLLRTSELRAKVIQRMKENERRAAYIMYGRRLPEDRLALMVNERFRFE